MVEWCLIVAGICLIVAGSYQLGSNHNGVEEEEVEEPQPWGFTVKDGGVVDGGSYDGWEED